MTEAANLIIEGKVATINLNRPKSLNSYNLEMANTLLAYTERLSFNKEVKVVLLRGEGSGFMAGGDIGFFAKNLSEMPHGVRAIIRTLANTIQNMRQSKAIYLAAVHGAVAGAGMSLMLGCDFVIAESKTAFTTAYSRLGTSPDGGLSYFLPKLIGAKKAMELLLLSEQLTAQHLLELGMINQVVSEDKFGETIDKWLTKLKCAPTEVSSSIKQLVYQAESATLEEQFEREAEHFIKASQTPNFAEGVQAFLAKRMPEFS